MAKRPYQEFSEKRRKTNIKSVTEHRRRKKVRAVEYKGGKCRVCAYKRSMAALQFHHLDPSQKDFGIGHAAAWAWDRIKKEIDKCVLLCANCHIEVHNGILDLRQYLTSEEIAQATSDSSEPAQNILVFFQTS